MEEETSEEEKLESGGNSKRSLMYRVGKKILITGMVITSAPFVLPPLVVVSTIGFAFAVPFGFVFASYACTQKVMSKLLSRPPMVESIEEGGDWMEREEEEFEEDMKKKLEMRMELIGDEKEAGEVEAEEGKQVGGGVAWGYEEGMEDMKRAVDEEERGVEDNSVEEPVGGIDGEEEEKMVREVNGFMGDEAIEVREIPIEDTFYRIEEMEEPVEGTEELMEEYRGEGNVDKTMEEEEMEVEEWFDKVEEGEIPVEHNERVVEVEMPVEEVFENIEEEKKPMGEALGSEEVAIDDYILSRSLGKGEGTVEESDQFVEERGNEVNDYIPVQQAEPLEGVEEKGYKENGVLLEPIEVDGMGEKTKVEEIVADEEPFVETKEMMEEKTVGETQDRMVKEETPFIERKEVNRMIEEEAPLIEEKEVKFVSIKDNAREIADESGFDLYGVAATSNENISDSDEIYEYEVSSVYASRPIGVDSEVQHVSSDPSAAIEEKTSKIMGKGSLDSVVHYPVSSERAESQPATYYPVSPERAESQPATYYPVSPERAESQPATLVSEMETTIPLSSKPSAAIEEQTSNIMDKESLDSVVHYPVSSETAECQPDTYYPVSSNRTGSQTTTLESEMETTIPSKEVLNCEQKIWELMNAVRKIVGYTGAIQPNLSEELKALYIFTGVEPPVGFKDPLDLVEVDDKLRLLMAIIGVK